MQGGDRHVDFETLLVHSRQEVALDLKQRYVHPTDRSLDMIWSNASLSFHLLIIELIKAEQVIKADNLVILNHLGASQQTFSSISKFL